MPYFEVQLTKKLHRTYTLEPGAVIGRAPQCEIQLLSRAVSRRHARVEVGEQGETILSDLGTKNGIKLNGQRVMGAAIVQEGDKVLVGDVTMTFRAGAASRPATADAIDLRGREIGNQEVLAAQQPEASFLVPAEPEAIAQFLALLGRARIESLDFDDLTQLKLQVALKEALENARLHGSGEDPSKGILVSFQDSEEEFQVAVRDEGSGFDVNTFLANAEEVDALSAVRDRASLGSGLGLRIILNCVDRLQFEDSGASIHLARFKAEGEVFVISDDESFAGTPASPLDETTEETAALGASGWVEQGSASADEWWAQDGGRDELDLDDLGGDA